jgi:hypothetical protein
VQLTAAQCKVVTDIANDLIRRGVPRDEAIRQACIAAGRVLSRSGMGEAAPEPKLILNAQDGPNGIIAEVRANVSPWLWVLSVVSFGMALVNAKKISKMFGDWKRRRQPA